MLGQRRGRGANISPALGQRLSFDRLHNRQLWREMNGRLTAPSETDRADRGKAISPPLCTEGRHN